MQHGESDQRPLSDFTDAVVEQRGRGYRNPPMMSRSLHVHVPPPDLSVLEHAEVSPVSVSRNQPLHLTDCTTPVHAHAAPWRRRPTMHIHIQPSHKNV